MAPVRNDISPKPSKKAQAMNSVWEEVDPEGAIVKEIIPALSKGASFFMTEIGNIVVEPQIRTEIDETSEKFLSLVQTIKEKGVLQPLLIEERRDGKFKLLAGERRYRAAIAAKQGRVPVRRMPPVKSQAELIEIQLIENLNREDLNPIDEANAYIALWKERHGEASVDEILRKISTIELSEKNESDPPTATVAVLLNISGKSMTSIRNIISLGSLNFKAQNEVKNGRIGVTAGYELARYIDHPDFDSLFEKLLCEEDITREKVKSLFAPADKPENDKKKAQQGKAVSYWNRAALSMNHIAMRLERSKQPITAEEVDALGKMVEKINKCYEKLKQQKPE